MKHISAHTGKKPYKCESCNYCAAQKYQFTKHLRRNTGDKLYKCNSCNYFGTQRFLVELKGFTILPIEQVDVETMCYVFCNKLLC